MVQVADRGAPGSTDGHGVTVAKSLPQLISPLTLAIFALGLGSLTLQAGVIDLEFPFQLPYAYYPNHCCLSVDENWQAISPNIPYPEPMDSLFDIALAEGVTPLVEQLARLHPKNNLATFMKERSRVEERCQRLLGEKSPSEGELEAGEVLTSTPEGLVFTLTTPSTLKEISTQFGVSLHHIALANNLLRWDLPAGKRLLIPVLEENSNQILELVSKQLKKWRQRIGRFAWPLRGNVSSLFGFRHHPILKTKKFHNGIDLKAPPGAFIGAAADGVVVEKGFNRELGNTLTILHRFGFQTLYGHCSKILVEAGEFVARGERVATVGSTGRSTAPHLHFCLLKDQFFLNPMDHYMEAGE